MAKSKGSHIALYLISAFLLLTALIVLIRSRKVGFKAAMKELLPWNVMRRAVDYIFTQEQESFLKELHPDAEKEFRLLIKEIEESTGYYILITSGYRSFQKQHELDLENGKNADPGYSYHNYGMAIDFNAVKSGQWLKKASSKSKWEASGIPAIIRRRGFRWGGDFNSYHDPVHVDLPMESINTLRSYAIIQFGNTWSKIKGNKVIF